MDSGTMVIQLSGQGFGSALGSSIEKGAHDALVQRKVGRVRRADAGSRSMNIFIDYNEGARDDAAEATVAYLEREGLEYYAAVGVAAEDGRYVVVWPEGRHGQVMNLL